MPVKLFGGSSLKIAVIDVAAQEGGALSVLNDFCNTLLNMNSTNEWYIVTSIVSIEESDHIHNIQIPAIKKTWLHRILWEKSCYKKMMKKLGIDVVLSLQNNALPSGRWRQLVYFHNVLLLQKPGMFKVYHKNERRFVVYANVLGPYIRRTLKRADKVIVQAENVKNQILKFNNSIDIEVIRPELNFDLAIDKSPQISGYIYPALPLSYKNFEAIIDAERRLNSIGKKVEILLTIDGTENEYAAEIIDKVKKVEGIKCIGRQSRESILEYYKTHGLIMVSKLESFGMPILEAMMYKTVVVALDYPYAAELLKDYNRAHICDVNTLSEAIIEGQHDYNVGNYTRHMDGGWKKLINLVETIQG